MTDKPDPNKVKVQLNVPISWQLMEDLNDISADLKQTRASLIRDCIEVHLAPLLKPRREQRERIAILDARQATQ